MIFVSGDYTPSMRVQGFFQTAAYLADGTYDFTNPQDWPAGFNWAFGDGLSTMTANYLDQHPLSPPRDQFEVVIANSLVTEWNIVFGDFPFACHTLSGCTLTIESGPVNDDSSSYDPGPLEFFPDISVDAGSASSPGAGTWAMPFSNGVPEPGTLALAAIAFGAIWGVGVIRRSRHGEDRNRRMGSMGRRRRRIGGSPAPRATGSIGPPEGSAQLSQRR